MQNRNSKRQGKALLVCAILTIVLGFAAFAAADGMKDDYRYYFSEEYRNSVEIVNVCGWFLVIDSIINCGMGLIYLGSDDKQSANENLTACVDCGKMISRDAERCLYCGSIMNRKTLAQNQTASQNGSLPAWKRVELENEALRQKTLQNASQNTVKHEAATGKCIFCGQVLVANQKLCGACGRRQD